jgi:hypothetical protein
MYPELVPTNSFYTHAFVATFASDSNSILCLRDPLDTNRTLTRDTSAMVKSAEAIDASAIGISAVAVDARGSTPADAIGAAEAHDPCPYPVSSTLNAYTKLPKTFSNNAYT